MSILIKGGVWSRCIFISLFLTSFCLLGSVSCAMAGSADSLTRRFSHGVNLSHWFAQSVSGYDPARLAQFVSDADLKALKAAGLDHVRLSVSPSILFNVDHSHKMNGELLSSLMSALDRIQAAGLNVVLDLHPVGGEKASLLAEPQKGDIAADWAALTKSLKDRSSDTLAFEVLNEPDPAGGDAWWNLQGVVLASIRNVDKHRIVIVSGGNWSGIDDLVQHQPYADSLVVYTIHYYAPILFTHQGADWSWNIAERVAALGWPEASVQGENAANAATQDQEARGFVRGQISDGSFTSQWMDQQFDKLMRWQQQNHVGSIYVGEFGVYAKAAPHDARLRWIAAVREGCENRNWGWALWDDSASFGFTAIRDGKQVIDSEMLAALGVKR